MGPIARAGVVCLMLLSVGLARLIEVELEPPPLALPSAGATGATGEVVAPGPTPPPAPPAPPAAPEPPPPATRPAVAEAPATLTYRVKSGDTLVSIARKVYGTSKGWERIFEANKGLLKSPTRVRPGMELKVPPPPPKPLRQPGTRGA